jgi:hypothetical protein
MWLIAAAGMPIHRAAAAASQRRDKPAQRLNGDEDTY